MYKFNKAQTNTEINQELSSAVMKLEFLKTNRKDFIKLIQVVLKDLLELNKKVINDSFWVHPELTDNEIYLINVNRDFDLSKHDDEEGLRLGKIAYSTDREIVPDLVPLFKEVYEWEQ